MLMQSQDNLIPSPTPDYKKIRYRLYHEKRKHNGTPALDCSFRLLKFVTKKSRIRTLDAPIIYPQLRDIYPE